METESIWLPHNAGLSAEGHKCEMCFQTFHTFAERNLHIIQHFNQMECSVCYENLIQIGNAWYSKHEHSVDKITEIETDSIKQEKLLDEYQTVNSLEEIEWENSMEVNNVLGPESISIEHEPLYILDAPLEEFTDNLAEEKKYATQSIDSSEGKSSCCPICNKQIKCKTSFKYHLNVCNGVKPYECGSCNKAFADKRNLVKHLRKLQHKIKDKNDKDQSDETISTKTPDTVVTPTDTQSGKKCRSISERRSGTAGVCGICNKKFTCRTGLKYHMNIHLGIRPFKCDDCDKSFHDKRNWVQHKKYHSMKEDEAKEESTIDATAGEKIASQCSNNICDWICEYCNADFELELRLAKHVITKHGDDKELHVCNICAEKFKCSDDLLVHIRTHPESKQFVCTYIIDDCGNACGHGFAFKSSLGVHTNKHNRYNAPIERKSQDQLSGLAKQHAFLLKTKDDETASVEISFTCSGCDKQFDNRTELLTHIQTVHRQKFRLRTIVNIQFECRLCNETFANKSYLRCHLTTHEKDAACNLCGEKFSNARLMLQHRERHGKKRVVTCRFEGCNKIFDDQRTFQLHLTEHPSELRKKFICSICGKSTSSQSYYRDHMNVHNGLTPYECPHCGKKFAKSGTLYRHKLIHTGGKPYKCSLCDLAYRDSIDLKRHKFSVHKIYTKKHICPVCSKVFSERKLLTKHIAKVHEKIDFVSSK